MIFLPFDALPRDEKLRTQLLHEYFAGQYVSSTLFDDTWSIDLHFPDSYEHYIDPRLMEGLFWWQSSLKVSEIPFAFRKDCGFQLYLNDSWTLFTWSQWLSTYINQIGLPTEIVVLHIDDHDDLMSPKIWKRNSGLIDAITGNTINIIEPDSIHNAISSGAIGIGNFIVPLLHSIQRVQIRHLCATSHNVVMKGHYSLSPILVADTLLDPINKRIAIKREACPSFSSEIETKSIYTITAELNEWLQDLPANVPVLLHIDMDYFNDRYNGDSDWELHPNPYDPSQEQIIRSIDLIFDTLYQKKVIDKICSVDVALSPGFFPAEFWEPSIERIRYHLSNRSN
jgi:hypothetical protein